MKGNVSKLVAPDFNSYPSYGFISMEDGQSFFFHKNELVNCNIRQLEEGDAVEFEIGTGNNGRECAVNVRKLFQASPERSVANPGVNPSVNFSIYNDDEQKIIKNLGKVFYVTSGGREFKIGNSTYRYCLIKPTDYYISTFQLSREIAVIFCDYISFEPRSLDAASHVYKITSSKLRLDRGCHLLICHDDKIEEKLTSLLKDNNVNQIVIPFTYRELLQKGVDEALISSRFKRYLFDTDLFSVSAPIQNDIFFFGRRDYVHDIVSKCKNGINSGVFGLRRSGKTSLLYAVQSLLRQQGYPTVFIPCESDLSTLDWRTALCKVVLNVYNALGEDTSEIREVDYRETPNTTTYFEEDLDNCLKKLSLPITIMFDEIEAITFGVQQGFDSTNKWLDGQDFIHFWNTIKGYYTKNPTKISILVAGTNPMINEVPAIGEAQIPNPMFRALSESNQGAYLQAFTIDDTKNMVNTLGGYMGLSFNEYSIGRLTSDCGGHPYLMRILCSHINKYIRSSKLIRPCIITKAIYDKALTEFEKSSEAISFFWMILNILMTSYPKEYNTLKILALQGDEIVSQIQDKDSLFHLIGYGLVECNQNKYAIKYDIISRFLRGEYKFERQGLSVEEQKEEIQVRINKAEIQLRNVVKNTLRSSVGVSKAKDLVLEAMDSHTGISTSDLGRAVGLSYNQLFDTSVNNMYFSVLKIIILNNVQVFQNVFEQSAEDEIRFKLTTINNARKVPDHSFTENAENWSWKRFLQFRDSITWLENVLIDYE